jgi:hypothetical protein
MLGSVDLLIMEAKKVKKSIERATDLNQLV